MTAEPLSLFDPARPVARRSDPITSHQAAASIPASKLAESQAAVLRVLRALGPCTDVQLARWYEGRYVAWELPRQTASGLRTRRRELVDLGLVADSGRKEPLASGRQAIVWEIVRSE